MTIKCAADFADWYDTVARNYTDEVLTGFVDKHPNLFGVAVAGYAGYSFEFGSVFFVDLARLGTGVAEGSAKGVFSDILRALSVVPIGKVASVGKPIIGKVVQGLANSFYWRTLRGKLCVPIAIGQALQLTGQRLVVRLTDVTKAMGRELASFDSAIGKGASITEARKALNALKAQFDELPAGAAQSWDDIVMYAEGTDGVLVIPLNRTISRGGNAADIFHSVMVAKTSQGVQIFDRSGLYRSLDDLSRHYGSMNPSEFYRVNTVSPLLVIKNWVLDPALAGGLNALGPLGAVVLKATMNLAFNPDVPPEAIAQAFQQHVANAPPPAAPPIQPPANPQDYLPDWPVTRGGVMLSKVSLDRYGTYHLWPLIWDENRALIGSNPNKVPVGVTLKIKKKEKYTPAQIEDAKRRSPNWASYR